jgi:hypothetical protein
MLGHLERQTQLAADQPKIIAAANFANISLRTCATSDYRLAPTPGPEIATIALLPRPLALPGKPEDAG